MVVSFFFFIYIEKQSLSQSNKSVRKFLLMYIANAALLFRYAALVVLIHLNDMLLIYCRFTRIILPRER